MVPTSCATMGWIQRNVIWCLHWNKERISLSLHKRIYTTLQCNGIQITIMLGTDCFLWRSKEIKRNCWKMLQPQICTIKATNLGLLSNYPFQHISTTTSINIMRQQLGIQKGDYGSHTSNLLHIKIISTGTTILQSIPSINDSE